MFQRESLNEILHEVRELRESVAQLRADIAQLRAEVDCLGYREAVGVESAPADPVAERYNKMFNDGLEELFGFDGKPRTKEMTADGEE